MKTQKNMQETTRAYFDQNAKNYDTSHDGQFVKCMYREIVRRAVAIPGERILDLGCGNGNVIRLLQKQKPVQYFGVDLSKEMIREAEKRVGRDVDLRVADATELPYHAETFDIVICNASFHHYTEPEKAAAEIWRVLKKNGVLILGDPTAPGKLLLTLLNWGLHCGDSGDYRIYSKRDILPLFTQKGFVIQDWKRINYRSFVFNAVKQSQPPEEAL